MKDAGKKKKWEKKEIIAATACEENEKMQEEVLEAEVGAEIFIKLRLYPRALHQRSISWK